MNWGTGGRYTPIFDMDAFNFFKGFSYIKKVIFKYSFLVKIFHVHDARTLKEKKSLNWLYSLYRKNYSCFFP